MPTLKSTMTSNSNSTHVPRIAWYRLANRCRHIQHQYKGQSQTSHTLTVPGTQRMWQLKGPLGVTWVIGMAGAADNQNIEGYFWPQFRTMAANSLIKDYNVDVITAYSTLYSEFPEQGNCWCYSTRFEAPRGSPKDDYDNICRMFHQCIRCSEYSLTERCVQPYLQEYDFTVENQTFHWSCYEIPLLFMIRLN